VKYIHFKILVSDSFPRKDSFRQTINSVFECFIAEAFQPRGLKHVASGPYVQPAMLLKIFK